ncbi:unnamed protein product [Effrenium voratum]|nr:unnamed protein product [Effrenium voratum]
MAYDRGRAARATIQAESSCGDLYTFLDEKPPERSRAVSLPGPARRAMTPPRSARAQRAQRAQPPGLEGPLIEKPLVDLFVFIGEAPPPRQRARATLRRSLEEVWWRWSQRQRRLQMAQEDGDTLAPGCDYQQLAEGDRYHELDDGPQDQRYIAALSDARLEGSAEGVYFVLRGLGMKAMEGPGDLPRIEIMAAQHPRLFAALRRLGLRHVRDKIILEPSEAEVSQSRSLKSKFSSSAPELRVRRPKASAPVPKKQRSPEERHVFFECMALPKCVGQGLPYQMALAEARLPEPKPEPKPELVVLPEIEPPPQARPKEATQEVEAPSPWSRLKPSRSAQEQTAYFSKLSQPRVVRPKVGSLELPTTRVQSSFGRQSERHLLRRLMKIEEEKQQAMLQQEAEHASVEKQKERRAVLQSLFADESDDEELALDGIFPPEPTPVASAASSPRAA